MTGTFASRLKISAVGLAATVWASLPLNAATAEELTFGIVPQQSATRLAQEWIPVLQQLGKETGFDIRFQTAKDIPTFEACLAKNAYDLAYMNPYHYTTFHELSGYRASARQKDKKLKGLIVVPKDSAATSLNDLAGEEIAFPSPAAFGASVIPRAELTKQDIAFTPVYVKSHDSVYRAVNSGLFAAGGGVQRTFDNIPADIRSSLRIIYETAPYTPHAFAAAATVDDATVEAIAAAMVRIGTTEPALLEVLGMKGIERAVNADWDDIRALNLHKSDTQIIAEGLDTCRSG